MEKIAINPAKKATKTAAKSIATTTIPATESKVKTAKPVELKPSPAASKPEPTKKKKEVKKAAATTKKAENAKQIAPIKKETKATVKTKLPASASKAPKSTNKIVQSEIKKKLTALDVIFQLKFSTEYGQNLYVSGNHPQLGNGDIDKALPMQYFNDEYWVAETSFVLDEMDAAHPVVYNYVLKFLDGTVSYDCGKDKQIDTSTIKASKLLVIDGWNYTGYFENAFYTEPFSKVLLKADIVKTATSTVKKTTHLFQTKTPLLSKGQTLCLLGNCKSLGAWDTAKPLLMSRSANETHYSVAVDLSKDDFPIVYKFGVYDNEHKKFIRFEDGNNRFLYDAVQEDKLTIVNDAFAVLPVTGWRGAGVAIPVFSLRSANSFGAGEFNDLKLLVDWACSIGLKMIQLLPVNDTTANRTKADSYPYAAISAFALHPLYLNVDDVALPVNKYIVKAADKKRLQLNELPEVDYEQVMKVKLELIHKIYSLQKRETLSSEGFKEYYNQNKHWLQPYAVFCYLRDEYGTSHFNEWPAYRAYKEEDIAELTQDGSTAYDEIAIHYFIQYHLHLQLKEAAGYAHSKGVILKGDIAIGVYRYGADAWQQPNLYHLNAQAGAPPDDFAVKGQNWGFPTYNWQRMKEDGFAWWSQRFEQMRYYFDAFRIDHILGFFRIWSIPMHAVEGILGHFVPAIPIHINELFGRGIEFNHHRFTKPYITESVLWDFFGYENEYVKENFVEPDGYGNYNLLEAFATQRLVENHFAALEETDLHHKLKNGLYNLISNVILFEEEGSQGQQFHFRFGMEGTSSFQHLDYHSQHQLKELYVNYFFERQDEFWRKEAMQKLPFLKRVTNMLICGEDLGLVPACVPDVMKQLGLLSLEIQRMPKDSKRQFFHPNDAPYLSVVTPSTHDMSTIRGWWQEDKAQIQQFYNHELGQWGDAPFYCEAWINKSIVAQHLYSPAMWAVFQLQDLMGIDENLRRINPDDERINIPSNSKHYWCYRMHIGLEDLILEKEFNSNIKSLIKESGRG